MTRLGAILAALSVIAVLAGEAGAQTIAARAGGTVLRLAGRDSIPVRNTRVILHRVARAAQGPIDSLTTDAAGRFRFRFRADTSAVYLVSARYGGIEYFSPPVHLNPARPDTLIRVLVSDTSSAAPLELEARHLVIAAPGEDGSRTVLDLSILRNAGDRTRVGSDSSTPTWTAPLPRGSIGLDVGQGDYSPDAVARRGDRLVLLAPVAPGEKQVIVQYALPSGLTEVRLPIEDSVGTVNVLLAERAATVSGAGLAPADTEVIEGRTYRRWAGAVKAGSVVLVKLPGPPITARWALPALVAAVALGLLAAAARLFRAGRSGAGAGAATTERGTPAGGGVDDLLTALARLDAQYAGREADLDPAEWARYRGQRAQLKAALEAALARRVHAP